MTLHFCVIGNPIEHSLSPWIHHEFGKQLNIDLIYTKVKTDIASFSDTIAKLINLGMVGCNITAPFKQEAYKICHKLSARAAIAKSINTLLFTKQGEIYGDNTDGVGLINDLCKNLNVSLRQKTILILGAGGAVRGVLKPLLNQAPKHVIIANRTLENAKQLANEFLQFGNVTSCQLEDFHNRKIDIIINATSNFDINSKPALLENSFYYDLNYKNSITGLGMLVEQAAESFFIWTGRKPTTKQVLDALQKTMRRTQSKKIPFET